jgi:4-hydroxy-tetrahydrodipicolinate reductase
MTRSDPALRFAIAGAAGRMGRQLAAMVIDRGMALTGASEAASAGVFDEDVGVLAGRRPLGIWPSPDVIEAAASADVWIDFTRPHATLAALAALKATPVRAVVIGTTGFTPAQEKAVQDAATRLAIVKAGNFSVGVNLLEALTRLAASRLGPDWDIEILETHHRLKADAPSGTALMLGEAAAEGRRLPLARTRSARTEKSVWRCAGPGVFMVNTRCCSDRPARCCACPTSPLTGLFLPRARCSPASGRRVSPPAFTAWTMCWVSATPPEESAVLAAYCALTRRSIVPT